MDATDATERAFEKSETVLKAFVLGDGVVAKSSNSISEEDVTRAYAAANALEPPYDPNTLTVVYEHSNSLRSNVEAYVTNIDGFGHHFEPILDPENDDKVETKVRQAIYVERLIANESGMPDLAMVPSDEEVTKKLSELEALMAVEKFKLERFFDFVCINQSFVQLRRETREDLEITGNAYWEIFRGENGSLWDATFTGLTSRTMRLLPQDSAYVEVTVPTRNGPLSAGREKVKRRFRRFVQVSDNRTVYFKEFGDPRVMSAATGKFFPSVDSLRRAEKTATVASEVIHFRIRSGRGPYGVPRWIGNLLSVLGSRQAEEVNFLYFENKSVPPLALLVSGGRVTDDTVRRVQDFITNEIKGKRNFHKILVIEAVGPGSDPSMETSRMRVELKPLTSAQHSDALFQKYDERNIDKVGMSFRLSRMLRGDVRDFNRATATAALEFAESQVFNPEREAFDFTVNRLILAELGVYLHKFKSNGVLIRDPREIAGIMKDLASVGGLVPADIRRLASELVFGRDLPTIDADWIYQPVILTQTGVPLDAAADGTIPTASAAPNVADIATKSASRPKKRVSDVQLEAEVRRLVRIRDAMHAAEKKEAADEFAAERVPDEDVIRMSRDELKKRFGIEEP